MDKRRSLERTASTASSMVEKESVMSTTGKKKKTRRRSRRFTRGSQAASMARGPGVEGLEAVRLSSKEQRALQVVVGENLSPEMPWARVRTQKVRDDLKRRGEDSPFTLIKDQLLQYKYRELFIGYDVNRVSSDEFLVTTTRFASEVVGRLMARLEAQQRQKVIDAIWRRVHGWRSLGSEDNVSPQVLESARAPVRQEARVRFDPTPPPEFEDVDPGAQRGGHTLLSNTGMNQQRFKIITRKCYSSGAQARPDAQDCAMQTEMSFPVNMGAQYEYVVDTDAPLPEGPMAKVLAEFLKGRAPRVEEMLRVNTGLDVFLNDFQRLVRNKKDTRTPPIVVYKELESFIHVESSKGNVITAVSWHPNLTGMAACAYVSSPRLLPQRRPRKALDGGSGAMGDPVIRDVHASNGVLVWCFTDSFKPKLCLESPRPVHSLAFCPWDGDMLVGGLSNGQMVVWDLKDSVQKVEEKERLTPAQESHRTAMQGHLKWMKVTRSKARIPATAVSSVEFSHHKCVRAVRWISPYWPITTRGHYPVFARSPPGQGQMMGVDDRWGLQLLSAAEDGAINVWDLREEQAAKAGSYQPRKKWKVRERLPGLEQSDFQKLNRLLRPHFRIEVEEPQDDEDPLLKEDADRAPVMVPLSAMAALPCPVTYVPEDMEELFEDLLEESAGLGPTMEGVAEDVISAVMDGARAGNVAADKMVDKAMGKRSGLQRGTRRSSATKGTALPDGFQGKGLDKAAQEAAWEAEEARAAEDLAKDDEDEEDTIDRQRKHFNTFPDVLEKRPDCELDLGTMDGRVMRIKWQGLDSNLPEVVNHKRATILSIGRSVHDGPVALVLRSPFAPELLLSVGGKVWAIWRDDARRTPLLWRRAQENVYAAAWSAYRPAVIVLVRADGVLEAWDLTVFSEKPAFTQTLGGKQFSALVFPDLPLEDKMVGVGDNNGALRVYFVPEEHIMSLELDEDEEVELLRRIMSKERQRQRRAHAWEHKWRSHVPAQAPPPEEEDRAERAPAPRTPQQGGASKGECSQWDEEHRQLIAGPGGLLAQELANQERWRHGEEMHMRRTMLRLLQWDKEAIVAAGRPLVVRQKQQAAKRRKLADYLAKKYALFEKTVAELFPELTETEEGGAGGAAEKCKGETNTGERFLEEFDALKPAFVRDFIKAERKALHSVRKGSYTRGFDWILLQHEANTRRTLLDVELREVLRRRAEQAAHKKPKTYWKLAQRGEPVYRILKKLTDEVADGKHRSVVPGRETVGKAVKAVVKAAVKEGQSDEESEEAGDDKRRRRTKRGTKKDAGEGKGKGKVKMSESQPQVAGAGER